MKKNLILILAAIAAFTLPASAGEIVVVDLANVTVDGQPAGKLVDVVLNYRARAAEISAALEKWAAAQTAAVAVAQATAAAARATAEETAQAAIAAAQAIADGDAALARRKLAAAALPAKTRRIADLAAEKARIEKAIADESK